MPTEYLSGLSGAQLSEQEVEDAVNGAGGNARQAVRNALQRQNYKMGEALQKASPYLDNPKRELLIDPRVKQTWLTQTVTIPIGTTSQQVQVNIPKGYSTVVGWMAYPPSGLTVGEVYRLGLYHQTDGFQIRQPVHYTGITLEVNYGMDAQRRWNLIFVRGEGSQLQIQTQGVALTTPVTLDVEFWIADLPDMSFDGRRC